MPGTDSRPSQMLAWVSITHSVPVGCERTSLLVRLVQGLGWATPSGKASCVKLGERVWGSQATLLCTASPGSDLATPFCPFVILVGQYANMSFYLGFPLLRYEYC